MKIYTRTGDEGLTSLLGHRRVSKADRRVEAYGEVDELNACLGLARAFIVDDDVDGVLSCIQRTLFAVGAALADEAGVVAIRVEKAVVTQSDIARLEQIIDHLDAEVPPLRRFVLPGGHTAGAYLHLARTMCRRAERRVVALGTDPRNGILIAYLNRLSDLLFVLARAVNHRAGIPEAEW